VSDDAPLRFTDPDDCKLAVLARSARARSRAPQGAGVRDRDGRTYAAATVDLPHLQVSALGVAVAMAVSSGATGLEAAVVVGDDDQLEGDDVAAVRDFSGGGVPVWRCGPDGAPRERVQS
jgi:hypothetical protein